MNLPLLFARRYLLAKRSQNAVNVITIISIVVIAVVTGAMVVVLSTLNGIGDLVDSIYSPFDQDITITPATGKTFPKNTLDLSQLNALPEVQRSSWVIEENVLLRCGDQQGVATMKGVEPQYLEMSRLKDFLFDGAISLEGTTGPTAILGIALKTDLAVPLDDGVFQPLEISAPIRGRKLSKYQQRAFEQSSLAVSGTYTMNMEFDAKYAVVPLEFAQEVLHYDSSVSALEVQLKNSKDMDRVAKKLRVDLGPSFIVKTRYQKNALMYQTNASEKLFTFIILVFIGLIGAFNIIASLTMMMIEKQQDMRTLISMGATPGVVRRVFFNEGLLIVIVGIFAGLALGLGICFAQQQFGFVALSGSVVEAYPVLVQAEDLVVIFFTVLTIGVLAAWVPLRTLSKRFLNTW
ncbi:MAG: ABC transporter permease [Flavobacteriales bacterium]|nr:ABC transporter permease [Flavobacteriales bacterium]MBK6944011.1 ABC transporter permease [Flavobacteriales bacterium]MBK7240218.1 ABC transporter permease [Flavobacteriales bacterium]MBK9533679.1 ABC transporter permease [Flavobacteriales bacterium]MBP9136969.1 ABC transporter permease [Flavobacteriales bacterium]